MPSYWVTFRVASNTTYQKRYDAMLDAMKEAAGGYWGEPTSFFLIASELSTDALTRAISRPLASATDLLVVCDLADNETCYFGNLEYLDIFREYLPEARKVG